MSETSKKNNSGDDDDVSDDNDVVDNVDNCKNTKKSLQRKCEIENNKINRNPSKYKKIVDDDNDDVNDDNDDVDDDGADNVNDDNVDDEDETPENLLVVGKKFFKEGNFNSAVDVFSSALEKKVNFLKKNNEKNHHNDTPQDISDDDDINFSSILSEYYLWFGDSLLCKEEKKNQLFNFDEKAVPSYQLAPEPLNCSASSNNNNNSTTTTPQKRENTDENSIVSDDQLAFEILEMAKEVLIRQMNKLTDCSKNSTNDVVTLSKVIKDLSFVYIRLADLSMANTNYEEASEDYKKAYDLRCTYTSNHMEKSLLLSPLISYAQSLLFSGGKQEKAVENFEEAKKLATEILVKNITLPVGVSIQNIKDTVEDLTVQIQETKQMIDQKQKSSNIKQGDKNIVVDNNNNIIKGSQIDVKSYMASTTSSFDTPCLISSSKTTVSVLPDGSVNISNDNNSGVSTLRVKRKGVITGGDAKNDDGGKCDNDAKNLKDNKTKNKKNETSLPTNKTDIFEMTKKRKIISTTNTIS